MTDLNRIGDDLRFVRASVDGAAPGTPPAVYFLWSILVLYGFVLLDLWPERVPLYWTIAAPAGGLVSAYLGWRHQRSGGHLDASRGIRYALHWGALLAAIVLGSVMVRQRLVSVDAFGPIALLLVAQAYFYAGLHLDKPMRWVGLLMAAAYLLVLSMASYAWTLTGVLIAAALVASGLLESRGRAAAA
jgi:hypothetical protein